MEEDEEEEEEVEVEEEEGAGKASKINGAIVGHNFAARSG